MDCQIKKTSLKLSIQIQTPRQFKKGFINFKLVKWRLWHSLKYKFSNKALDLIGDKQFSSSEVGQIVYNVGVSIDTDLETLEAQTNGSGFVGLHSPATTYQFCIQLLQLFNDVFKDNKLVEQLFKEMLVSVTSYQNKV